MISKNQYHNLLFEICAKTLNSSDSKDTRMNYVILVSLTPMLAGATFMVPIYIYIYVSFVLFVLR